MDNLLKFVRDFPDIPEIEENKFREIVSPQRFEKGDVFIRAGSIPQKLAFVESGLFRYYYVNEKGGEFTKGFFPENSFITSYTAMIMQRQSHYTIEALERSEIFVFQYEDWMSIYHSHAGWSSLLIALLQKGYSKKENRERELLLLTAEERYRAFLVEYPQLESRVKQHIVASYLGITPVALSRIRKDMRVSLK